VLNLGAEGIMAVGAIAGFAVAHDSGADARRDRRLLAGALMALFFGILTLTLLGEPGGSGLALSIFGVGLSAFVGKPYDRRRCRRCRRCAFPLLADIPLIGPAFFQPAGAGLLRWLLFGGIVWFLYAVAPGSCCARSANRRRRRTRSAIR
jgi:simple sugar transport system permease protein